MELLSSAFRQRLEHLAAAPPQAILLIGDNGVLPDYEADQLAQLITSHHGGQAQRLQPEAGKTGLAIAQIRSLYVATRGKQAVGRAVWLVGLDGAAEAAQNAFLKLLEEPPQQVIFIILVSRADQALVTIRSRSQPLQAARLEASAADGWLRSQGVGEAAERRQLIFLAEGGVSELQRLGSDTEYRQKQLDHAALAKQLVSGSLYDSIKLIATLASDRDKALRVVHLAITFLRTLASNRPSPAIMHQLAGYIDCYEQLAQNGNIRAQLLATITRRA